MFKFGVIAALLVCLPETAADTCTACKSAYDTAKGSASGDADKCAAIVTYLHCLEGSAKDDDGCPLPKADSDAIETDYADASCNGGFTDTCICQKNFWATDVETGGASAVCSATTAYIACLKGKTDAACDGSTTVVALATGVETRITNLGTSACAVSTACQCEITAAKADISSDGTKCTAYKAQYACLYPLTTAPCVGTIDDLKTAAATSVTSTTSCTFDDTCVCQRAFDAATKTTNAEKCAAHKTELSCLRTAQSPGCDGTTTKSAIATTSESTRAALSSDCPALTTTCQCEVDAAKGAAATSATYCTVLTTLKTCLSAIIIATEEGCTATTQAALLTDTNTKITEATCGSAADHVTFATTSLIVSVLVNMFL